MSELWFENPPVRIGRPRRRRVNANTGGLLMIANKRRHRRRRKANPINRRRRSHTGRFARVRHMSANPRRRSSRRSGGGFGAGMPSFLSGGMLKEVGFGALGAVAPTLVTDRILPLVGLTLTGWTRRIVQLAVPTAVLWLGGTRFVLGKEGLKSFALGAYIVTVLGIVNEVTGGIATVSGAPALGDGHLGAFQRLAPGLGNFEDLAATGYAS